MFMLQNFSKQEGEEKTESDKEKSVDPVYWYGLFAPQTLKDAQSRFVSKVMLCECLAYSSAGREC